LPIHVTAVDAGVATVTLDAPSRMNAFDRQDLAEFHEALDRCERDASVRAVVVLGAGRGFCAGADLAFIEEVAAGSKGEQRAGLSLAPALLLRLVTFPKPTVAAVHGAAFGGGACLALACDDVVLADDARLGLIFTALGLPGGDMAAPWLLTRRVGSRRAWRLLATAAVVPAGQAVAMGLADAVVPAQELIAAAAARAEDYASRSSAALATTKRQLLRLEGMGAGLEEALADQLSDLVEAFGGPDMTEGFAAQRERRAPRWASAVPSSGPAVTDRDASGA
jgi:methylglutaconyl-CoA hydratase